MGDIVVAGKHLPAHLRLLINLRPYADHEADAHVVQIVGECLGVGVVIFIEAHGIPPVLAPVLPVLYQHA